MSPNELSQSLHVPQQAISSSNNASAGAGARPPSSAAQATQAQPPRIAGSLSDLVASFENAKQKGKIARVILSLLSSPDDGQRCTV